jgi:hypothetical protein
MQLTELLACEIESILTLEWNWNLDTHEDVKVVRQTFGSA